MALWLFKEEPEHYSYAQLEADGTTLWSGVTNNLARKYLRAVKKGDRIFYYHTGGEKAVVAIANSRWPAVMVGADQNAMMNPSMSGWRTQRYRDRSLNGAGRCSTPRKYAATCRSPNNSKWSITKLL